MDGSAFALPIIRIGPVNSVPFEESVSLTVLPFPDDSTGSAATPSGWTSFYEDIWSVADHPVL